MTNKPEDYDWVEYLVNAETRKYLEKNFIGKVPPVEIYDFAQKVVEKTIIAMPDIETERQRCEEMVEAERDRIAALCYQADTVEDLYYLIFNNPK